MSLESQAASLGIPMQLLVDDGLRYSYCSAHMGNLTSIEGKMAVYSGECPNRHKYEMKMNIEDIKKMAKIEIVNGEQKVVYNNEKGFEAEELRTL